MNILRNFIDLIYPRTCFSCNCSIEHPRQYLCPDCENKMEPVKEFCEKCGSYPVKNLCNHCSDNNYSFSRARSVYKFGKEVQVLVHNLKYNEFSGIARFFARKMAEYINSMELFNRIDLICPVPLHKVKKRERGYNQAELISKKLSDILNIRHLPHLIKRKKYTETQTSLSKRERKNNVKNAFRISNKYNIADKNILLIDDVFTTGATVNSISNLLKHNGVGKIYVLTIARA